MRTGCELEKFLQARGGADARVVITMSSGEVFIGTSIDVEMTQPTKEWVRIEPLASGYRDAEHRIHMTTSYVFPAKADGSSILLPFDEIRCAHEFSVNVFADLLGFDLGSERVPPVDQRDESVGGEPKAVVLYKVYVLALIGLPVASFLAGPIALIPLAFGCMLLGWAAALPEHE